MWDIYQDVSIKSNNGVDLILSVCSSMVNLQILEYRQLLNYVLHKENVKYIPGFLSFMFVSVRSFEFLMFQIDPLYLEFVSDRSFKVRFIDPFKRSKIKKLFTS